MTEEQNTNPLLVPLSIIIAGAIIGGSLYFKGDIKTGDTGTDVKTDISDIKVEITKNDYIFGSKDSLVTIVEFSDTECPYCKNFHKSLIEVLPEYEGKISWVYRHLPLPQLHPKAPREAEATECAGELGGNDMFWAYTNRLFEITPSNNGLEDSQLPEIAETVGLDKDKFIECLNSGDMTKRVTEDSEGAVQIIQKFINVGLARGVGTPFSVLIDKDGKIITPIPGAVGADVLRQTFNQALEEQKQ